MAEETNPREELYERFKASLKRPVADRYFDEDELVEIYDYAGDLSDDYVQLEVLFCGARLYPASASLAERRALMYLDTSVDDSDEPTPAAGSFLNDNPELQTPLFEIARLQINRPSDPEGALEYILGQFETLGDEEIIRFLDLAFDLGCYDWVISNLPRLRTKVKFMPTLVYEIMREAESSGDDETVITLAEELIESEPFAVGYWVTLFKAQAKAGKEEDAKSSFDYARALGADNPDALLILAESVYSFAPYLYSEAYEIIEGLKEENPDEFMYTDCQCAILVRMGAGSKAINILREYLDKHPGHSRAMRQLLACNVPDASDYLDRFYDATGGEGFDPATYAELVTTLSLNGSMTSLEALLTRSGAGVDMDPGDFCAWIESLYALGRYEELAQLVDAHPNKGVFVTIPLKGSAVIFAYIVALMKLGRGDDANAFFSEVRPALEAIIEDAPMPVRMSIRTVFTLADKMRRHPADDTLYWEYFNMLNYEKK
ncbi:MAG: hypothetical protein HDS65_03920 [Bacteroidales bacterium]|nr:hypothetical protein [Bacteroidales bacterium]